MRLTPLALIPLLALQGCSGDQYVTALDVFNIAFQSVATVLPASYRTQVQVFVNFTISELESKDAAALQVEKIVGAATTLSLQVPDVSDPNIRTAIMIVDSALRIFITVFPKGTLSATRYDKAVKTGKPLELSLKSKHLLDKIKYGLK